MGAIFLTAAAPFAILAALFAVLMWASRRWSIKDAPFEIDPLMFTWVVYATLVSASCIWVGFKTSYGYTANKGLIAAAMLLPILALVWWLFLKDGITRKSR